MDVQETSNKFWKLAGIWAAAVLTALALFIYSSLSFASAEALQMKAAEIAASLYQTVFTVGLSESSLGALAGASALLLPLCGFALLAFFIWWALRLGGFPFRRTVLISFGASVIYAAGDLLHRVFISGRYPLSGNITADLLGIMLALLCVMLCRWLWVNCPRVYNWETISYVIFGVLTTLVNIIAYSIFAHNFGLNTVVSNTIAWVFAVLFAYIVNKLFVFRSHNETINQALREFGLFIGARVFSLGVDDLGMLILADVLHVNDGVSKILMNIIVMVMNYFFSKWIIFKKADTVEE